MSSIREKMMAKTAELRSAKDIDLNPDRKPTAPRTGPGMASALASAQERIAELEKAAAASAPTEVRVADIRPNPWQPRRVFNEGKLNELASSIRASGLIQPIVVRPVSDGYEIVAGERRWRAHRLIGKGSIRVVQVEISDQDMAMLALAENIVRDGLSDYEISLSIRQTEKEFPNRSQMASALGMARSDLYRLLSFADLPDFIIKDLDLQPNLLGATAAETVVSVLKKHGDVAIAAARTHWADVVSGELDQTRFGRNIKLTVESGGKPASVRDRSIEKIFAGKNQAGSITKDSSGFTVKIKPGMLGVQQEERIRNLLAELFGTTG
ncbi:ParB/RepB/Spo0J family partition protein [Burkholderia sp. MSMB1498]|uniref:ParB/RepB/Spo0J family partition protein n=1 Tax=Burkholderia sp. MSMB1498 TaxID=1637842 RepID=UPI00075BF65F|nr:ParB/RepB/Spo0J family partition protein [Burkholderia sp. MSMB1498]KVK89445.1 chromosome partitioning protein ParB [Burkholderia sp. MSMB1498]